MRAQLRVSQHARKVAEDDLLALERALGGAARGLAPPHPRGPPAAVKSGGKSPVIA